jgi:tripartite-type tricarboxylate transporter receptor subunit TctC
MFFANLSGRQSVWSYCMVGWKRCLILTFLSCSLYCNIASAGSLAPEDKGPIRLIVPATPGGGTDAFAHVLADMVGPMLGRRIVVDNRPGASGAVGVTLLTAAMPDGNTLAFTWNGPLTASPQSLPVSYGPNSYKALMSIGYSSYTLCARADEVVDPATYLSSLKSRQGLTYSDDGTGGTLQLAAERVFRRIGVRALGIPFSGAGDSARGFDAGFVDIYGGSIAAILPQVRAGTARCFLLTSRDGNPALAGTPGLAAHGLEAEETVLWWGLIAPARTPRSITDPIEAAFVKAAASPEFERVMRDKGAVQQVLSGEDTSRRITEELAAMTDVARDLGLQRMTR